MRKAFTTTAAVLALAGTALMAAAPADAQHYRGGGYGRGYYGHNYGRGYRGGGAGLALGAGILGLAAGAAIASGPRYGYSGGGYYAPPPPPAYGYGYDGYGYGYEVCHTERRWDGYRGRYVPVRYCD